MRPHIRAPAPPTAADPTAGSPRVQEPSPTPPVAPGQHGIYGYGHFPATSTSLSTAHRTASSPEQLAAKSVGRPASGQASSSASHTGAPITQSVPGHDALSYAPSEHLAAQHVAASTGAQQHPLQCPPGGQLGVATHEVGDPYEWNTAVVMNAEGEVGYTKG